jgi:putative tryptophan/tyrosine transport system substrate-binding protein
MAIKTTVVFLVGLAFGLVHVSEAQQSKKVPRIGYVSSGDPSTEPRLEAFRRGLRDLGYIEGKNIQVEYRYIEGSRTGFRAS